MTSSYVSSFHGKGLRSTDNGVLVAALHKLHENIRSLGSASLPTPYNSKCNEVRVTQYFAKVMVSARLLLTMGATGT